MRLAKHGAGLALDALHGARDLLLPPACLLCNAPGPVEALGFCARCDAAVAHRREDVCAACGAWLGESMGCRRSCAHCMDRLKFMWVVALGNYENPGRLRDAVLAMKSIRGRILAQPLGIRLARAIRAHGYVEQVDMVTPVPLHRRMRVLRGYNQAAALAEAVAAELRLPIREALRRRRVEDLQATLTRAARRQAVKGTVGPGLAPRARGKRVLLVDDVLTTGATASECAGVLRELGARCVAVAVLARAIA